jgi:anti-sigma factor RsiW
MSSVRKQHAPKQAQPLHPHPGHAKARCLKIFRRLSAYLDGDLPGNVCEEIRKHVGDCPNCEVFVESLRMTISLCRKYDTGPLPPAAQARLKQAILRAVSRA